MGYTARLVLDWTDHVWTEVYIEEWQRWAHCDSCEPLFDKPLTYEKGWGKQLTYIVAFSNQEIVDVTRRYVIDPVMNKMRRKTVNEKWLADLIKTRREMLWDMQGPQMAGYLRDRYFREEKELFGEKEKTASEEYLPRQSGSLEWRAGRGEMGAGKGVMDSTAGSATVKTRAEAIQMMKNMQEEAATAKQEEAKKQEVVKPQLPKRPDDELFAEAQERRSQIKQLTEQIQKGCQQIGCDNKEYCLSANPALHSQLGLKDAKDKVSILVKALELQRAGKGKTCA